MLNPCTTPHLTDDNHLSEEPTGDRSVNRCLKDKVIISAVVAASMALGFRYFQKKTAPNFAHRRPNRAAMFATGRMRPRPTPGARHQQRAGHRCLGRNGWFTMEIPIQMDDFGLFFETSKS